MEYFRVQSVEIVNWSKSVIIESHRLRPVWRELKLKFLHYILRVLFIFYELMHTNSKHLSKLKVMRHVKMVTFISSLGRSTEGRL